MKSKVVVFLMAVFFVLATMTNIQANVLDNGYAMVGGGAFGTVEQAKTGTVKGFFTGAGLLPIYMNSQILARISLANYNNNYEAENYSGSVMLLSRTIDSKLINPYVFGALSLSHTADAEEPEPNTFSIDGGMGVIWELIGGKWFAEVAYKKILNEDSFSIGAGLIFDLSKPAEGEK